MQWPLLKKIAFRWLFVYLLLFCLGPTANWLWRRFVPWVGDFLGVDAVYRINGSGDTTFHYVLVLSYLVLALAATFVWSLVDHKRPHYHGLYLGLRVLVRLVLGLMLITYGAAKVFPMQFPPLPLHRLVQTFGDASPMGLLWTFMGASMTYTIFCGMTELLGGVLLFFRRTTTLGALVSIAVMTQVAVLNFSYDVPVKLISCHLLAMSVFLAAADARRLANLFVLNRTAGPAPMGTVLQSPRLRRAGFVLKVLLLAVVAVASLYPSYLRSQARLVKGPLTGIWDVQQFTLDGEAPSSVVPDSVRWRRMVISDSGQSASVHSMDGTRRQHTLTVDLEAKKLFLDGDFTYSRPTLETLHMRGTYGETALSVTLRHVAPSEFRLVNRGFHWISESPYNR